MWEHFYHQADIGVRGIGPTAEKAFEQAALALTAVVCNPDSVRCRTTIEVDCEAPDVELLFADWLNALIYEMATRSMLFRRFEVTLECDRLHGSACGEMVDVRRHQPAVEIKGATYTALEVRQDSPGLWHAQCVVDV